MKTEVNENEVVKHWGIFVKPANEWLSDQSMKILAFTCPRVTNAQHDIALKVNNYIDEDLEVREIK